VEVSKFSSMEVRPISKTYKVAKTKNPIIIPKITPIRVRV
jgi:hypothetical protein